MHKLILKILFRVYNIIRTLMFHVWWHQKGFSEKELEVMYPGERGLLSMEERKRISKHLFTTSDVFQKLREDKNA